MTMNGLFEFVPLNTFFYFKDLPEKKSSTFCTKTIEAPRGNLRGSFDS